MRCVQSHVSDPRMRSRILVEQSKILIEVSKGLIEQSKVAAAASLHKEKLLIKLSLSAVSACSHSPIHE
jgi:hypothetical protein